MKNKVIYVPLDDRNCNYGFPWELGTAAGLTVLRPPEEIMSCNKRPCDMSAMWAWLENNVAGCTHAILSLDTLVYGCLINSRRHAFAEKECLERMSRLARLKELNPALEVHAFNLIMRTSNCNNSSEEPDYWAEYGMRVWKYSWLTDKKSRVGLDAGEEGELADLSADIPREVLADYTGRRTVNLKVNLEAVRLVKAGVIDRLVIPKDDNSEYGFSTQDSGTVYRSIVESGVRSRVYIYPGADEVGCTLMCRVLNLIKGKTPKIYVYYSSTFGPDIVAKYEDRPINESVKWQVMSSGAMTTADIREADIVLMVNTPGKYMVECAEQWRRDYSYVNFRNIDEFVQKMKRFIAMGKRCAVADIAYPNGADNELMEILCEEKLLDRIFAYGGWNTCANTLGVVILQATAAMALGLRKIAGNRRLFAFHLGKLIEDWAYQANVLNDFTGVRASELGLDCYRMGALRDQAGAEIAVQLNAFIQKRVAGSLRAKGVRVKSIRFPWDRLYDIALELEWQ